MYIHALVYVTPKIASTANFAQMCGGHGVVLSAFTLWTQAIEMRCIVMERVSVLCVHVQCKLHVSTVLEGFMQMQQYVASHGCLKGSRRCNNM